MSWQIILQILFIIICAVITTAESALISLNDSRLEKLVENGGKKAHRLKKLTDNPNDFLLSSQTAVKLSEFVSAGIAVLNFSGKFSEILEKSIPENVAGFISVAVILLIITFLIMTFGEFIPKRLSAKNPEKLALRFSGILTIISALFRPFVLIMNAVSCGILKLIGVNPEKTAEIVTEEEILMMSDAGAETGAIDEDENRIIKNIFAFDDMTAGQICTHRTEVSVLWADDNIEVWEEIIHRTRHSVFPVCSESIDNVIGVLDAKDYFRTDKKNYENIMKNAIREPYFVHENMKADKLFAHMKKNKDNHFAVVVDEYGGMSGIITITDLVEKLVGEFADDEEETFEKVMKTGINTWTVQGNATVGEVCDALEISLDTDKNETFGGYVIAELGNIPKNSEKISIDSDGLHIEILKIKHHRIELCRVTKSEKAETIKGDLE
ncbi:MAG: hemolysin family protein [Muribaculaceae bacterium]|nr:hemolysin family protein [Alistipes senegalensis]MCM1473615.1 hemolysin family protein [Muribaculaceae bacterium]